MSAATTRRAGTREGYVPLSSALERRAAGATVEDAEFGGAAPRLPGGSEERSGAADGTDCYGFACYWYGPWRRGRAGAVA